jgi:hypothetical protein
MIIDKSPLERHYTRGDLLERILAALAATGKDVDALVAADWARRARLQSVPLGMGLLHGDDFPAIVANQERNLLEGRVVVLRAVAVRG